MTVSDRDQILADVRRGVLSALDFTFGEPSLGEFSGALERYDGLIAQGIVEAIISYHDVIWPYSEVPETEGSRTLAFGKTVFEVTTGHDLWEPNTLNLAFIPRAVTASPQPPPSVVFEVEDGGTYSSVRVFRPILDFAFEFQLPLLEEMVTAILQTGQAWLSQRLLRLVSEASLSLSRELYQLLWRLKPRIDRQRVWFLLMCNGRAFYLVEEVISLASIELFSRLGLGSKAPMQLYVDFITANLPIELVLSRQAEHLGTPLQADLSQSKYRASNTTLIEAEMAVFGESLMVTPLYLGDSYRLVAIYPSELGDEVSPILAAHQEDFATIMMDGSAVIDEMDAVISQGHRLSIYAKAGEFFGGFITGVSQ